MDKTILLDSFEDSLQLKYIIYTFTEFLSKYTVIAQGCSPIIGLCYNPTTIFHSISAGTE